MINYRGQYAWQKNCMGGDKNLKKRINDGKQGERAEEDGWRGFRIQGVLDFSLIGIFSKLSGILAENKIGIFAISTYNTDYILVKGENFDRAMKVLEDAGYKVIQFFARKKKYLIS